MDTNRLDSLTGARFLAALAVFVCHLNAEGVVNAGYVRNLGYAGVEFFFVLSGFVLTWSAPVAVSYLRFVRRRLVKIFPNHVVTFTLVLLVFTVLGVSIAGVGITWRSGLANLFLVSTWWNDIVVLVGVNGPSWSLCVELFAYLLFPLMLATLRRVPAPRLPWVAAGALLTIWLMPLIASQLPGTALFPVPRVGERLTVVWFVYFFPPSRLFDFVLGIVAALLVQRRPWPRIPVSAALAFTVISYGVSLSLPDRYAMDAALALPLAVLVGSLATRELRSGAGLLGKPVLRTLGDASFAFYLIHLTVLIVAVKFVLEASDHRLPLTIRLAFALGCALIAVALALALHYGVEKPAMRRFAGRSPRAEAQLQAVRSEDHHAVRESGTVGAQGFARDPGDHELR